MNETGYLWVVATPLGNAEDLSPRARRVLADADVILAEDTRRAGLLFKRLGLERHGRLMSFFEHNEEKRLPKVLGFLEEGLSVALISDAGTPLLSDPGFTLVRACREQGFPVSPVPGPSAPVAALSASGLPPLPYTFLGFTPRKKTQTEALFLAHRDTGATLVLFERKSRLAGTLAIAADILGDREFCVARELTKEYEEFLRGRLGDLGALDLELRGELTVIIAPASDEGRTGADDLAELVAQESEAGGKPKEIARRVAARAVGWTAKEVYATMRPE
jgi:16S rRNA (cytidine1402-2'-O)-methyltransferase